MKKSTKPRKKIAIDEFSKGVVFYMLLLLTFWVNCSFVLSLLDKNINEGVTIALIINVMTVIIGYYISNASNKHSRNKYNLDSNGKPIMSRQEEIDIFVESIPVDTNDIIRQHEDNRGE